MSDRHSEMSRRRTAPLAHLLLHDERNVIACLN